VVADLTEKQRRAAEIAERDKQLAAQRYTELQKQYMQAEEDFKKARIEAVEAAREVETLRGKHETLEQDYKLVRDELGRLRESLTAARQEYVALENKFHAAESDLSVRGSDSEHKGSMLQQARERATFLQEELERVREELRINEQSFRNDSRKAAQDVEQAQTRAKNAERSHDEAQAQIQRLKDELADAYRQMERVRGFQPASQRAAADDGYAGGSVATLPVQRRPYEEAPVRPAAVVEAYPRRASAPAASVADELAEIRKERERIAAAFRPNGYDAQNGDKPRAYPVSAPTPPPPGAPAELTALKDAMRAASPRDPSRLNDDFLQALSKRGS
jgi:DNA repair exonuclease SbcCD ATPase subunit